MIEKKLIEFAKNCRANNLCEFVKLLLEKELISEKSAIFGLVKSEYIIHRKTKSHKSSCMDLAIEFSISERTVENIIYKKY
jgi:hypothetical protein